MRRMRTRLSIGVVALVTFLVACGGGTGPEPTPERPGDDAGATSPWLYCTTDPCQPLALVPEPTPPALSTDRSLAAPCDANSPDADDGILLWHTDWDPETREGRCVSVEEAEQLGAP